MRLAVAVLTVLTLTAPSLAAETCRGVPMPPKSKQQYPTVYFKDYWLPRAQLAKYCGNALHPSPAGCAYPSPTKEHPDGWTVLIAQDLSSFEELSCVYAYEHAHLPPNNWTDPEVELKYHYNPN